VATHRSSDPKETDVRIYALSHDVSEFAFKKVRETCDGLSQSLAGNVAMIVLIRAVEEAAWKNWTVNQ
jgi:hypothetical protein